MPKTGKEADVNCRHATPTARPGTKASQQNQPSTDTKSTPEKCAKPELSKGDRKIEIIFENLNTGELEEVLGRLLKEVKTQSKNDPGAEKTTTPPEAVSD